MKFVLYNLLKIIANNLSFLFFILLLGIIPNCIDIFLHERLDLIIKKTFCTFCYQLFICSFLIIICEKILKCSFIKNLIKGLWILLFVIEMIILLNYESSISPSLIFILINTNKSEINEFIQYFFTTQNIFIFLLLICSVFLFYYLSNRIKNNRISIHFIWIYLIFLLGGLGVSIYAFNRFPSIISYRVITPIERFSVSIWQTFIDVEKMKEFEKKVSLKRALLKDNKSNINNIVLIIGESLSRTKMGCYGYELNTTPNLDKHLRDSSVFLFTDVIAPVAVTNEALVNILTSYNADLSMDWYDCELLIEVMEQAGYTTYWISNQESFGIFANLPVTIAKYSDVVKFTRIRNSTEEKYGRFDSDLLPIIKSVLENDDEKRFIVVHMMGCHTGYKYRYPIDFEKFTTDSIKGKSREQAKVIAEYNNSVLYNDFVVNEILSLLQNENTLAFYFSDHGEEVYDFRNFMGHGLTKSSRYMAEIPFIVYTSDLFKKNYPQKIEKIRSAANRRFMLDDMFHTVLDISDIETVSLDSSRAFFSPFYNNSRRRIFNKKWDYDKELKNKN